MPHRWPRSRALLVVLLAVVAPAASAQDAEPPAKPCATEEYRQFDFWVGEWQVTTADGSPAGKNSIRTILDGCALEEQWTGAQGSRGRSLNLYFARDGLWHQTWVDSNGLLLHLAGKLEGQRMVMHGEGTGRDGRALRHRLSWQPLDDGRVRQHWEVSRDGGESWSDVFVGLYRRED